MNSSRFTASGVNNGSKVNQAGRDNTIAEQESEVNKSDTSANGQGSEAVGGDKSGDSTASNGGIGTIESGGNVTINYNNDTLPGYFPGEEFKAPPSDLSKYKTANLLTEGMIGLGDVTYIKKDIFVRGVRKETVFKVRGSRTEQRVGFKLDGQQKAVLLQFGLEDLQLGTTDLTYLVKISADGKLLWAGDCRYGQKQQIVSVPLSIPGATSLLIEYTITVPGKTNADSLYFTKAELLSN